MILSIIVAADENNVIGRKNNLLWRLPDDMRNFRKVTEHSAVIMGRKTYDSIGKPLPNRENIIISRQSGLTIANCKVVHSLKEAIESVDGLKDEIFVIGGGEIYKQAMPMASRIYLTRVHAMFQGDVVFPEISDREWKKIKDEFHAADEKNPHAFTFCVYERI